MLRVAFTLAQQRPNPRLLLSPFCGKPLLPNHPIHIRVMPACNPCLFAATLLLQAVTKSAEPDLCMLKAVFAIRQTPTPGSYPLPRPLKGSHGLGNVRPGTFSMAEAIQKKQFYRLYVLKRSLWLNHNLENNYVTLLNNKLLPRFGRTPICVCVCII